MGWGRYEPEGRRTRTEENGLNWIIHKHQGEGVFAETYPVKDIEGVSTRHLRGPARGGDIKIVVMGPKLIGPGAASVAGTTDSGQLTEGMRGMHILFQKTNMAEVPPKEK